MLLIAALALAAVGSQTPSYYVSPAGDDSAAGTKGQPFQTLDRARDAVRALREAQPKLSKPVLVRIESGTYYLDHPFILRPQDSGTQDSPTYFVGDRATISGGQVIKRFQVDARGWWHTVLPGVRNGPWRFSQLFVNGHRRYRPHLPKQGYYEIAAEEPPSAAAKGHGYDRFGFRPGDIDPSWHDLNDVELLCFHIWDMSRMRIGSIDGTANVVTTTGPTGFDAGWANFPKGNRYLVENVREALGEPGQWYLDTKSGELTYIPIPGETPGNSTVVAPRLERLVDIEGDVAAHRYVEDVGFQQLKFEVTNWDLPAGGRFSPQAESDLGAAIQAEGWRDGGMRRCAVEHTGEYAIELGGGCRNAGIYGCSLSDLGAGGVKIGEIRQYDDEGDCAGEITVSGCAIEHGGRLHPAAIGVWIGQSAHNRVANNEISDFYYTGVSVGWTWGYGKSEAHDNRIEYNQIHDVGQGVLSDMGGIYTLGVEPGTRLVGNRIYDVESFSYGGWGIYPDEGSSNEVISNNVVYRTKSGGFHQHYGQENLVVNNIFAFAREAQIIRTRAEDHISARFEHNIVYWSGGPLLGSNWSGNNYRFDGNDYWRTDGKPVDFAGMSLEQWRAKGQDLHSEIADPMFVNPAKFDFRLKKNSPAFGLGFVPFDESVAGPTTRPYWAVSPQPPAFPVVFVK